MESLLLDALLPYIVGDLPKLYAKSSPLLRDRVWYLGKPRSFVEYELKDDGELTLIKASETPEELGDRSSRVSDTICKRSPGDGVGSVIDLASVI